jgi:DNA-binding response OmpR family regulator
MTTDVLSVLVVEDEALIRMSLVADLEDAGFRVFEASTADQALEIFNLDEGIEALFTDIDMPGSLDGLQLARIVRKTWPQVSIILTSGHLKVGKGDLPVDAPFLSKPYDVRLVVNHIRELARPRLS